jgi:hypothetical protein
MKTPATCLRENNGAGASEPFSGGGESPDDELGSAGVERTLE